MTRSVPGLVLQMVGFLGTKKFHCTPFFVDDQSDYTFVHHQFSISAEERIKAKHAHEYSVRNYEKEVRHYYAENGTHAVASYKKDINDSKQTLNFCGEASHHNQNGKD